MKDYIKRARQLISAALSNPGIRPELTESGYDEERLREGLALCGRVEELMEHLERDHGRKLQSSFGMAGENMLADESGTWFRWAAKEVGKEVS